MLYLRAIKCVSDLMSMKVKRTAGSSCCQQSFLSGPFKINACAKPNLNWVSNDATFIYFYFVLFWRIMVFPIVTSLSQCHYLSQCHSVFAKSHSEKLK